LTVIFARRENARREEDGPGRFGRSQASARVVAGTACLRVRVSWPGGGAAPGGLPPVRARQAAAPEWGELPVLRPALVWFSRRVAQYPMRSRFHVRSRL